MRRVIVIFAMLLGSAAITNGQVLQLAMNDLGTNQVMEVHYGSYLISCYVEDIMITQFSGAEVGVWVLEKSDPPTVAAPPVVGDPRSWEFNMSPGDRLVFDRYSFSLVEVRDEQASTIELRLNGWCALAESRDPVR